jgi:hypothetical protein
MTNTTAAEAVLDALAGHPPGQEAGFPARHSRRLNLAAERLDEDSLAGRGRLAAEDLARRGRQAPLYWVSDSAALVSAAHVLEWHDAVAQLAAVVASVLAHRDHAA